MTNQHIIELLEIMRNGNEPYFSDEGQLEFYRLLVEMEGQNEEKTA
jgi:hypothetical protein